MESYHGGWQKHDPSQGPPTASAAPPGIQPPQVPPQPSYPAMRPGPPVPPPLRTLGIPARPPYGYGPAMPGALGKSTNPIPPPARSHLVHTHPRQHPMYHPMPPPPAAPAPHSYYQPYAPQPPPAQPTYPVDYGAYRQPPPLRATRQQEPSRQPPPPQAIKHMMPAPSHLNPRHLGAAAQMPAVHEAPPQNSNIQASSLPGPITSAPSAIPRSVSQQIPIDNSGQQAHSISSAPLPNSQRLQPVGHTVGAQRAAHHPVATMPPAETAREESHIVGSTAGAQVVMVTTDPQLAQNGAQPGDRGNGFRQLKVEDALMYLEQVKSQFTDNPAVYNRFLDIMKEFKAQSIDTAEVIKRVSHLFQGHKGLILGFNTFLPPGYKIELRDDPATGLCTTGYRAPGGAFSALPATTHPPVSAIQQQQHMAQQTVQSHQTPGRNPYQSIPNAHQGGVQHQNPYSHGRLPAPGQTQPQQMQHANGATMGQHATAISMNPGVSQRVNQQMDTHSSAQMLAAQHNQDGAAAALVNRFGGTRGVDPAPTEAGKPIEFNQAVNYVNKIKSRFSDNESVYKSFLDILQTYQKEQRTIKEVYKQVSDLFRDHQDLLNEFSHFLPEAQPLANSMAMTANPQYSGSPMKGMDGVEYPAVAGNGRGPNAYAGSHLQDRGNGNTTGGKAGGFTNSLHPLSTRKNVNATSSDTGRKNRKSSSRNYQDVDMTPALVLSFFAEIKEHLGDSAKNNYKDLIKLLNLVAQEIMSVDELPKLMEGLFEKHKELYSAFKMFMNYEDPNAAKRALALLRDENENFEEPTVRKSPRVPDVVKMNEKYRKRERFTVVADMHGEEIEGVEGYKRYPKDLGGVQCSGMTDMDRSVLNFEVAGVRQTQATLWNDADDGSQWAPKSKATLNAPGRLNDKEEDGAPQSPTGVLERQMPSGNLGKISLEDQRAEFDVLIGCTNSSIRNLKELIQDNRRKDGLKGCDWVAIKLIYADSFEHFEKALKNRNEFAMKTVHDRLDGKRKEWIESQKFMEKVWRTHRYASTDNLKNYTRSELLDAAEVGKESQLKHNMDNRKLVDDLVWFMLEWTADSPEKANEMMEVVGRIYNLLGEAEDSLAFTADKHLYCLIKLLAIVSDVSEWLVKRPDRLEKTVKMVQSTLEGTKNIVEFEEYCKETYGDEGWQEVLPDFIVILKKLLHSVEKAPMREGLLESLEKAEKKEKDFEGGKKKGCIRITVKRGGDGVSDTTTLKFEKIETRGNTRVCNSESTKKKKMEFVRYIEKMAEKKRKRKKDKEDGGKESGEDSSEGESPAKKAKMDDKGKEEVEKEDKEKKSMEMC